MKKSRKKTAGFTLIELMIVVAVIAILAVIAIPKFGDMVNRSKEADVKKKLGALRSAVSIYYSDNQYYPVDLTTSLTTEARYIAEIPSIALPSNSFGNPGHPLSAGETLTLDDNASGAWLYSDTGEQGAVLVNCSHMDSRGMKWTTF